MTLPLTLCDVMEVTLNTGRIGKTPMGSSDITDRDISLTPGLWCASIEDAIQYGGEVTRYVLGKVLLSNMYVYKHILVDVKVHMLMPGMWPAIPGWHTDGIPRSEDGSPMGPLSPAFDRQKDKRSPLYHLVCFGGAHSQTSFILERNYTLDLPRGSDLYEAMTRHVNRLQRDRDVSVTHIPADEVWTWDWWEMHTATPAAFKGWRYLLRVTETDYLPPQRDLRKVIRTQQMAYLPRTEYGW